MLDDVQFTKSYINQMFGGEMIIGFSIGMSKLNSAQNLGMENVIMSNLFCTYPVAGRFLLERFLSD